MARNNMEAIRRGEISQALYRCIVKRGFSNTTLRDIAREAHVSLGLTHYYFRNKDEILFTLMNDIFNRYRERWRNLSRQNRNKPPRERLLLGIRFMFMKMARDKDFAKAFYELWNLSQHNRKLHHLMKSLFKQYREEAAEFVSECLTKLGGRPEKARELGAFLVGACEGVAVQWVIDPRGVSLSKNAKIASQFLEAIIEAV